MIEFQLTSTTQILFNLRVSAVKAMSSNSLVLGKNGRGTVDDVDNALTSFCVLGHSSTKGRLRGVFRLNAAIGLPNSVYVYYESVRFWDLASSPRPFAMLHAEKAGGGPGIGTRHHAHDAKGIFKIESSMGSMRYKRLSCPQVCLRV